MSIRALALVITFILAVTQVMADNYSSVARNSFGDGLHSSQNIIAISNDQPAMQPPYLPWQAGPVSGPPLGFPVQPTDPLGITGDRSTQFFPAHVADFNYEDLAAAPAYNTFYPTDDINFTAAVKLAFYSGGFRATKWEVTDINDTVVSTGTFGALDIDNGSWEACYFTIPQPGKLGWYRVRLLGPEINNHFGNSYGGTTFCIVKPDDYFGPIKSADIPYLAPASQFKGSGEILQKLHAIYDMGSYRVSLPAYWTLPNQAAKVAFAQQIGDDIVNDNALDAVNGWTSLPEDPAHPHKYCYNVPYFGVDPDTAADDAAVAAWAAKLPTGQSYEATNEPDGWHSSGGRPGYQTWKEDVYDRFRSVVKGVDPTAKIMAPCPTTCNYVAIDWITGFLSLNPQVEEICFHPYNSFQGDAWLADSSMTTFKNIIANAGYSDKPLWCTEYGDSKNVEGGLFLARRFTQYNICSALTLARWGVPLERNIQFYDVSRGFWNYPSWHCLGLRVDTNASPYGAAFPLPTVPAYRTMSTELRGKANVTELSCGTAHDYIRAYQFDNGSDEYVTAFFTQGMSQLPVTVTGADSAVDMFGNDVTLTAGEFTCTDLPIYVRSSAPLTITDIGDGLKTASDITSGSTPSVKAGMSTTNLSHINDGLQHSAYIVSTSDPASTYAPYHDTNHVMPAQAAITWSTAKSVKRIGLFFVPPYQVYNAPIEFTVEALVSGSWTQVYSYSNPTALSVPFSDLGTGSTYETGYNGEWVHQVVLPSAISTTSIRVNVTKTSHGFNPDEQSMRVAYPQGGPQGLSMRDFRAYSN